MREQLEQATEQAQALEKEKQALEEVKERESRGRGIWGEKGRGDVFFILGLFFFRFSFLFSLFFSLVNLFAG